MAFAVELYIFDWIFFDDSSELKTWQFRLIRRAATRCPVRLYIPTPIGSVCAIYFPAWAFVLLILMSGQPRP